MQDQLDVVGELGQAHRELGDVHGAGRAVDERDRRDQREDEADRAVGDEAGGKPAKAGAQGPLRRAGRHRQVLRAASG